MAARERYATALSSTLQGASVPYGFTLTVWGAGETLLNGRGQPGVIEAALFVAGAAAAFALLRWLVRDSAARGGSVSGPTRGELFAAVALQIVAIAAAIGGVALIGLIRSGFDWPAGGFFATAVYLSGTAAGAAVRRS